VIIISTAVIGDNNQPTTIFLNSAYETAGENFVTPNYGTLREFYIGKHNYQSGDLHYFDGKIDEFRISQIARSTAWIETSYNTMNAPSSFVSFGPEETGP